MDNLPFINIFIDRFPEVSADLPQDASQSLQMLLEDIRRNLEELLNTPYPYIFYPKSLTELQGSLIDYGFPLFSAYQLFTEDMGAGICSLLKETISRYESRLKNIQISLDLDGMKLEKNILQIFIRAELPLEDDHEVVLHSILDAEYSCFSVSIENVQ